MVSERSVLPRNSQAQQIRQAAAELAAQVNETSKSNGEEENVFNYKINFTKGMAHRDNGILVHDSDYTDFVAVVEGPGNQKEIAALSLGPKRDADGNPIWRSDDAKYGGADGGPVKVRGWESMTAGNAFCLIGPDPQSVSMPPVPLIDGPECISELGELYLMALARDIPISAWSGDEKIEKYLELLNKLTWFANPNQEADSEAENLRRRGNFTAQSVFRGILPGSTKGPYLSQFLIQGSHQIGSKNSDDGDAGHIQYGAITIDQRVRVATPYKDYMTSKDVFLDVQDGANLKGQGDIDAGKRFITTLRDLATYVHYDALYEAYLNACLILLQNGAPKSKGLPYNEDDSIDKQEGFALFGGPHILTMVTEVSTRALKAIRYQKFNIHRRARPEAIAGFCNELMLNDDDETKANFSRMEPMIEELEDILEEVQEHNSDQNEKYNRKDDKSYLLPMAYSEGSPMHPSYGSGHATVAGACVTILKAFFDEDYKISDLFGEIRVVSGAGNLETVPNDEELTVGSELEKLADNISIGRDAAGVHWLSDQQESLLLGEKVAIQMLKETQLTLWEEFSFNFTKFNGEKVVLQSKRPVFKQ